MPPENSEMLDYVAPEPIAQKQESAMEIAGETLRAAAWSCVQMPIEGVTQLASKVSGKDINYEVIEAPKPAEFGTAKWTAQHVGAYVGGSLLAAGLHKAIGTTFSEKAAGSFGKEVLHGATTGTIYMGVLMPNRNGSEVFWQERAMNAVGGAALFGGGAAFSFGVGKFATGLEDGVIKRAYTSPNLFSTMAKVSGGMETNFEFDKMLKAMENK